MLSVLTSLCCPFWSLQLINIRLPVIVLQLTDALFILGSGGRDSFDSVFHFGSFLLFGLQVHQSFPLKYLIFCGCHLVHFTSRTQIHSLKLHWGLLKIFSMSLQNI